MKYDKVVGIGGIGTGSFYLLEGNHLLGREESRLAELTDYKDYCKQHIILSYVGKLIGDKVKVYAVGKVGNDVSGERLINQMQEENIRTNYVLKTDKAPTMTSVCLQYPDGAGCNITSSNSACNFVDNEFVLQCLNSAGINANTLAIVAPEVPLMSRLYFIDICNKQKAYICASFSSYEMGLKCTIDCIKNVNLISINIDEAEMVVKNAKSINTNDAKPMILSKKEKEEIAKDCYDILKKINSNLSLIVTLGADGTAVFEDGEKYLFSSIPSKVVSTAGAGDALLGGVASGLCYGMPLVKKSNYDNLYNSKIGLAIELGIIAAHFAVESQDSISKEFTKKNIQEFLNNKTN